MLFLATQDSVLASGTSDYQQPLAQISTAARDLTAGVCSVILSKKETTVVNVIFNVTHFRFSGNIFSFSLPRLSPNTRKTGKFNPSCLLPANSLSE